MGNFWEFHGKTLSAVNISYSLLDDRAVVNGERRWISSLHIELQVRLPKLLRKEVRIWRDAKLQGNESSDRARWMTRNVSSSKHLGQDSRHIDERAFPSV